MSQFRCLKCGKACEDQSGTPYCASCDQQSPTPTLTPQIQGTEREQEIMPASDISLTGESGKFLPPAVSGAPLALVTVEPACQRMAGYRAMHELAVLIADTPGYQVSIEYPLFLSITTPNGERVHVTEDSHDGTVTLESPDGNPHDCQTVEFDGGTLGELAAAIVDAIDEYADRGTYQTAAERRKADRDEQTTRNR